MRIDQVGLHALLRPRGFSIGQERRFMPMQRQIELRPEFSVPKQVRVPISSINAPKSYFNQLETSRVVGPEPTSLVTIAVVVPPDFTVLSFIAAFSFMGVAPTDSARQAIGRTSREAVRLIVKAQINSEVDEAFPMLTAAITSVLAANTIGAQFTLQDDVSGFLATSRSSTIDQKASSGTILFRRVFAPGRHVFTLGCTADGSIGISSGGASLYIQQSAA